MGKLIQINVLKAATTVTNFHEHFFLSRCASLMPHPRQTSAIIYYAYYSVRG
jgi:hypothetical protein